MVRDFGVRTGGNAMSILERLNELQQKDVIEMQRIRDYVASQAKDPNAVCALVIGSGEFNLSTDTIAAIQGRE